MPEGERGVVAAPATEAVWAGRPVPLLRIRNAFPDALCDALVAHLAETKPPEVNRMAPLRRREMRLTETVLLGRTTEAVAKRLFPAIDEALQLELCFQEPHLLLAYEGGRYAQMGMHRDNLGTPGNRHRRISISINLNDEFQGGELRLPSYKTHLKGSDLFQAAKGEAIAFFSQELHGVQMVTAGTRYAFVVMATDARGERQRNVDLKCTAFNDGGASTIWAVGEQVRPWWEHTG